MLLKPSLPADVQLFDKASYQIGSFADEMRVLTQCQDLLKRFHGELLQQKGCDPLAAGSYAAAADYFIRDFLIDQRQENIFSVSADMIRAFAGHWYITTTLEPNMTELGNLLAGVEELYRFFCSKGLISAQTLDEIAAACRQKDFYHQRIESFFALSGDDYPAWKLACPLTTGYKR